MCWIRSPSSSGYRPSVRSACIQRSTIAAARIRKNYHFKIIELYSIAPCQRQSVSFCQVTSATGNWEPLRLFFCLRCSCDDDSKQTHANSFPHLPLQSNKKWLAAWKARSFRCAAPYVVPLSNHLPGATRLFFHRSSVDCLTASASMLYCMCRHPVIIQSRVSCCATLLPSPFLHHDCFWERTYCPSPRRVFLSQVSQSNVFSIGRIYGDWVGV